MTLLSSAVTARRDLCYFCLSSFCSVRSPQRRLDFFCCCRISAGVNSLTLFLSSACHRCSFYLRFRVRFFGFHASRQLARKAHRCAVLAAFANRFGIGNEIIADSFCARRQFVFVCSSRCSRRFAGRADEEASLRLAARWEVVKIGLACSSRALSAPPPSTRLETCGINYELPISGSGEWEKKGKLGICSAVG